MQFYYVYVVYMQSDSSLIQLGDLRKTIIILIFGRWRFPSLGEAFAENGFYNLW